MSEPPVSDSTSETRQRIIEAALQELLKMGYARATTRRIAAAADVNEVTLFRHFGSKVNLIATSLEENSGNHALDCLINADFSGDLRTDLNRLGLHLVEKMHVGHDMMRFMMSEGQHVPELQERIAQIAMHRRELFKTYFEQQVQRGTIRDDVDPVLLSTGFTGMIFSYGMSQRMRGDPPDVVEQKISQLVDLFLNGAVPSN